MNVVGDIVGGVGMKVKYYPSQPRRVWSAVEALEDLLIHVRGPQAAEGMWAWCVCACVCVCARACLCVCVRASWRNSAMRDNENCKRATMKRQK